MGEDWKLLERERVGDFKVFSVDRDVRRHPRRRDPYTFYRIASVDWVNVVALTPAREVVLIRQFRAGIGEDTLEIPGGMVDPGESPGAAALRELREETGYVGEVAEEIGWVHPNPALFDNRCHTFLVRDARDGGQRELDAGEVIESEMVPLAAVPDLIRSLRITHALVVAAFQHLFLREEFRP